MEWNDQYDADDIAENNDGSTQGWDGHAHYTVKETAASGKWLAMCQGRGGHFFGL